MFPALLNARQRNLIYKQKYKTELETSPQRLTFGGERFQLKHVDRRRDLSARRPLVNKAIENMHANKDWAQLPALLEGLHQARIMPDATTLVRVIRMATNDRNFHVVLSCLARPLVTGLTLKDDEVLRWVVRGLRRVAVLGETSKEHQAARAEGSEESTTTPDEQSSGSTAAPTAWSEASVARALRYANVVAQLLERDGHTRGRTPYEFVDDDPRLRPTIIGAFLELAAINAYKYHDGKDVDGSVRKYADRLRARLTKHQEVRLHCAHDTFGDRYTPPTTNHARH